MFLQEWNWVFFFVGGRNKWRWFSYCTSVEANSPKSFSSHQHEYTVRVWTRAASPRSVCVATWFVCMSDESETNKVCVHCTWSINMWVYKWMRACVHVFCVWAHDPFMWMCSNFVHNFVYCLNRHVVFDTEVFPFHSGVCFISPESYFYGFISIKPAQFYARYVLFYTGIAT